uniref:NADH-ubiquinone oxidoreductase chain 4 n=1 Tax=Trigonopterus singkawangensis TaxID=1729343 RepID=A0A7H1KI00_9CUCU|nr:NADH dehydrogenase subunit 4 [Trigonopterus singkawangensis]QNT26916.1 NADH dehydrogenase subunit 4 [Trigonopterus singkawangensis]
MMEVMFGVLFMMPFIFLGLGYWIVQVCFFLNVFNFVLKANFASGFFCLSYMFSYDLVSYSMILLSLWICSVMILASEGIYKVGFYPQLFLFLVVLLLFSLILTFSSLNLFVFYLFFEVSLIPTLLLIVGWGVQPERILAGVYLLFYTLLFSLPMMVAIFYFYYSNSTLEFCFFIPVNSVMLYVCMNFVFFVKMPMYFVHLWLPKAHVEAPISGSMILAGVMLKLGGYGLMRVMKGFYQIGISINIYFIVISLLGGVIVSFMCIRQSDMKMLIAYSSVSHMGLAMAGILTLNSLGYWGALVLMLAHGLCSSGLFCLANLLYERTHSRSIYLNKGFINVLPGLTFWWFLLCSSNMAAPPSLNLLGEIMLINSVSAFSECFMVVVFVLSFYSAVYTLFLYSYTQHGVVYSGLYSFFQVNVREYLLLFLHWVPLNLLIFKSDCFVLGI